MQPTPQGAKITRLTQGHFAELDGLRGLAILLVVVYHFFLPYKGFHSADPAWPLQAAQAGWMGVDLFFVLSGFLITGILMETREQPHYFRNFLGRRFLRIWPLYYLSLVVLLVLLPAVMPSIPPELQSMRDKQIWFWLYGANWLFASEGGFAHTSGGYFWSLAVEEQFYLVWPFVVYALSRRALLRFSLALLAVSLVSRVVLTQMGVNGNVLYTMTFTHLDGLAVGSSLAILLRSPDTAERVAKLMPAVALAAALGLVAVRLADGNAFFWSRNMAAYGYTLIVVLFGSLLVHVAIGGARARVARWIFSRGFMTQCGKYSYALYMVHVPIASLLYPLVMRHLDRFKPIIGYEGLFIIFFAVAFAVSWGVAVASWYLFERHVLALKRHFSYVGEARAPEASRSGPGTPQR